METVKFVTLVLNENGDNQIINEYDNLQEAFDAYEKLDVENLEEGQQYEVVKYDENNMALDWEDDELISINQPTGSWVTKS